MEPTSCTSLCRLHKRDYPSVNTTKATRSPTGSRDLSLFQEVFYRVNAPQNQKPKMKKEAAIEERHSLHQVIRSKFTCFAQDLSAKIDHWSFKPIPLPRPVCTGMYQTSEIPPPYLIVLRASRVQSLPSHRLNESGGPLQMLSDASIFVTYHLYAEKDPVVTVVMLSRHLSLVHTNKNMTWIKIQRNDNVF